MECTATTTSPDRTAKRRITALVSAYLFLIGLVAFVAVRFISGLRPRIAAETTGEFIPGAQPYRKPMNEGVGR